MQFQIVLPNQAAALATNLRRSVAGVGDSVVSFLQRVGAAADSPDSLPYHAKSLPERQQLQQLLSAVGMLRDLDEDELRKVVDAMFERRVQPNETVISEGEEGDNFYVISSGTYQVMHSSPQADGCTRVVHEFCDSGSFGELALLHDLPRSATVKAISPGCLWVMDRRTFRCLVLPAQRRRRQEFAQLLRCSPATAALAQPQQQRVADSLQLRSFGHGETIVRSGDSPDGMYFVLRGQAVAYSGVRETARYAAGACFGDAALLLERPYEATVMALPSHVTEKTVTAFLSKQMFQQLPSNCQLKMRQLCAADGALCAGDPGKH